MLIKRFGFVFIIFLLCFILLPSLHAKRDSGINLIQFGDSAASMGRGGTGVSAFGADLFYLNPASAGSAERVEFGLQYGTLGLDYRNPDLSFALPTSYGVFATILRMISIPSGDALDIEKAYQVNIGGARDITDRLMLGASVNYFMTNRPVSSSFPGLSAGLIYRVDFEVMSGGFGISEPAIGISATAGLPLGSRDVDANFNQATAGYNFIIYKGQDFNLRFYNDISAINAFDDFPVKFGFESVILGKYIARAGFTAPQSYDYGDYTAGVGYMFRTEDFDGDINYAVAHYSEKDFIHYVGLNIRYGKPDREAPETAIKPNEEYISPNNDGKQDHLVFKTEVGDRSRIKGWKLQMLNHTGEVVKEYRVSERDMDEGLTVKGFFMKIFRRKESMVVPESILWDGTDFSGKAVPDGKYEYSFIVWDERENISAAKTGAVYVDNTAPEAIAESETLFSPNGDNKKDLLDIDLKITSSPEDKWEAGFMNTSGMVVRSFRWDGASVPKKVNWDGRDDNGKDAPEGLYTFYAASKDRAGNSVRAEKKQIALSRAYESADITCSHEYFSYLKNTGIIFYPYLSDTYGLEEWKIVITDDDGDVMKEIKGGKTLPENYPWMPEPGEKKLKDGRYYYILNTVFASGNIPASFKKEIIIDSTPPKLSLNYSPKLFSPDGDGENDMLTIDPEIKDNSPVKDWSLDIYAPSGKVFKSFSGKVNSPGSIIWDGIGRDNDIVESAADYYMVFSANDIAGNNSHTERIKLPVDVLVTVTERGLKIRISNIEFAFDKSELTGKAFPILNRVNELLGKYNKYNVLIEGHTDDIGEEEYNLKLSEARAKNVMDYLVLKGIDEKRLNFRGMGETMPFLPNTDGENRRRNRRVEFLLIKEENK